MRDFRDAKSMAHALRVALKSRAVETTHSDALELIAKAFGYDNWNILAAKIEAAKPSPVTAGAGAKVSTGTADVGAPKTLHCSFCGKSRHEVRKLIAGPLAYICDGCVQLCTDVVSGEDPLWKVLHLLAGDGHGDDGCAAVLAYLRGRSTDDLASLVERSRQFAESNRLVVQSIRQKLVRPAGKDHSDDEVRSTSFNTAALKNKSRDELESLQQGAARAAKRADAAVRLGMRVLGEREQ